MRRRPSEVGQVPQKMYRAFCRPFIWHRVVSSRQSLHSQAMMPTISTVQSATARRLCCGTTSAGLLRESARRRHIGRGLVKSVPFLAAAMPYIAEKEAACCRMGRPSCIFSSLRRCTADCIASISGVHSIQDNCFRRNLAE